MKTGKVKMYISGEFCIFIFNVLTGNVWTHIHLDIKKSQVTVTLRLIFVVLIPLTKPVYFLFTNVALCIYYLCNMYFWELNYMICELALKLVSKNITSGPVEVGPVECLFIFYLQTYFPLSPYVFM